MKLKDLNEKHKIVLFKNKIFIQNAEVFLKILQKNYRFIAVF